MTNTNFVKSRIEDQLESLKKEYHLLQASEVGLLSEREVLYRERQTQGLVQAGVQLDTLRESTVKLSSQTDAQTNISVHGNIMYFL